MMKNVRSLSLVTIITMTSNNLGSDQIRLQTINVSILGKLGLNDSTKTQINFLQP